jgi:glutamine synthetase
MSRPAMSIDELTRHVASREIDTVVLAMTDMQGRLQGKRFDADYFLSDVLAHGSEACTYLLAVDVDTNPVDGYALASWDRGYGDFVLVPDPTSLRAVPWMPGTALVLADVTWQDGAPVAPSPRQILRRQLDRLAEHGWTAFVGTELEFIAFAESYDQAWDARYDALTPASRYNVDYSILGTSRLEPLSRALRLNMRAAGLAVESAKGECNLGQHEITFRYDEAMRTCDNHVVYKTGAKEIAASLGQSLTFMAKYNEREGNSCHIHLSLRTTEGEPIFATDEPDRLSTTGARFLAGLLTGLTELSYFFAPNVNSYKRFQPGTFAPTAVGWGWDNRTCAVRVVGERASLRFENRLPGGDVNPYLGVAALIAAGLHGVEHELEPPPAITGNGYVADVPRVPTRLSAAAEELETSGIARRAFGDDVVAHYVHAARSEAAAFDAGVTDWERIRSFERM